MHEPNEYLDILNKLDDLKLKGEDLDEYRECVCLNDDFLNKLNININNSDKVEITSKLIAELCKSETCRQKLTESDFFTPLLINLKTNQIDSAKIQICRAIGNLCYYNDDGRIKFLNTQDSLSIFINLLKNLNENEQLIEVVLGCFHNITNENDTLKQAFCNQNILIHLKDLLKLLQNNSNANIFKYYLSILENLIDLDDIKEKFNNIDNFVYEIYLYLNNKNLILNLNDYYEEFFQFLDIINSLKDAKKQLCKTNFLETIISIVEIENCNKELIKFCGLFLTTLLTNDEDVNDVLEYRNRYILNKGIEWLNSTTNNEQLYLISAIIIANYTRSDKDVELLINNPLKPHLKMLNILKKLSETTNDKEKFDKTNLIHSLLGSVRNFCIAPTYRSHLINEHIIDIIIPFINWPHHDVKYKAIGVIRLIIKNCSNEYELLELCKQEHLESLVYTAATIDHPGCQGESSRLFCYLVLISIKYPKLNLIENLTRLNAFDIIVNQLKSEHAIMINEALLSLNIAGNFGYSLCSNKLKELKLNDLFKELFNKDQMPVEIKLNCLKLFTCFLQKDDFFTDEQIEQYEKLLKTKLNDNNTNEILKAYITSVLKMINNRN